MSTQIRTGEILNFNAGVIGSTLTGYLSGAGTISSADSILQAIQKLNGNIAAISGATAGNPTASVSLAAVNGSASTYMRSDGAPPLDVTIAPTWTGTHNWNQTLSTSGGLVFGTFATPTITFNAANDVAGFFKFSSGTPSGLGGIATTTTTVAGASYTNGTYNGVAISYNGSATLYQAGSGATANIVVSGNAITSITIVNPGTGYAINDNLTVAAALIGGTGTGFNFRPITAVNAQANLSAIRVELSNSMLPSIMGSNNAISAVNISSATSTASQTSPAYHLRTTAWNTGSSASQQLDGWIYLAGNSGSSVSSQIQFTFANNGVNAGTPYLFGSGGSATWSGGLTLNQQSLGTTSAFGIRSQNATIATSGIPVQYAPSFLQTGTAWNGSASQTLTFRSEVRPVNGTNPITGSWWLSYSVNAGTFIDAIRVNTNSTLILGGTAISATAWANNTIGSVTGIMTNYTATTYTDSSTGASTTITYNFANVYKSPTFASTNASVVYTNAVTAYFEAPVAGTNVTLTNTYSIWSAGATNLVGAVTLGSTINGATITATTGTLTLVNGSTLQTTGAFTLNLTTTASSTPTFPTGAGTLAYLGGNNVWTGVQSESVTLATVNASATLTAAQMQTGWKTTASVAVALTTATATATATQVGATTSGFYYDFIVDNSASTSSGVITITLGTGWTAMTAITGENTLTVAIGVVAMFRVIFTSSTVAKIGRLI